MSRPSEPADDPRTRISDLAASTGLRRIHILAWRDLADVEAGGSELHAAKIAAVWARAGIDVTMRTSHAAGAPAEAQRDGYRVIRRAGRYLIFPRAVVAELTGRHGARDALVEIWNGVPFFGPLWVTGPHVTWIHHPHTDLWHRVMPKWPATMGRVLERDIAPRFYRRTPIMTLSESSRRELIEQFGFGPDRVHAVAPGVDRGFLPGHRSFAGSHPELSLSPEILVVGRLIASKEIDRAIAILARLRERHPVRLTIIGEGHERDRLQRLVGDLDAAGWCELAGRVSEAALVDHYQRAWILLSCSSSEGWGLTISEAAACATPAVVSDIAGHRDSVSHAETGYLARSNEDYLAALTRLVTDPVHLGQLGAAAAARAERLTWENSAYRALDLLGAQARQPRR